MVLFHLKQVTCAEFESQVHIVQIKWLYYAVGEERMTQKGHPNCLNNYFNCFNNSHKYFCPIFHEEWKILNQCYNFESHFSDTKIYRLGALWSCDSKASPKCVQGSWKVYTLLNCCYVSHISPLYRGISKK